MMFNPDTPLQAWPTFARYREEVERGILHSPEWVEKMNELEKRLRVTVDDLRLLNRIDTARGHERLEAFRGAFGDSGGGLL